MARSPDDDLDLDALTGRAATFRIVSPVTGASRFFRGACLAATQVQAEEAGLSTYEIELGPKLALLAHRSRCRIFQHRSIPEIVEAVLREWDIHGKFAIDRGRYPHVEYRVQWHETDLAFVSRLLEEAGIAFTFPTDSADAPDVLFEDASHAKEAAVVTDHVEQSTARPTGPFVTRVRVGRKLHTGRVVLRDRHFRLASAVNLQGDVAVHGGERFERYEYRHGASVTELEGASGETPIADARGCARADEKTLAGLAEQVLTREHGRRREVSFETNVHELRPGLCLRIKGHPREELRDEKLLVTEVRTTGAANTSGWKIEGRAHFTELPFRPLCQTPKPSTPGVQTAVVVGPKNEDIHTDEYGRVRVRFAWDRENDLNEESSCWLRVSQGWAGGGHASFSLPRIGDEVLVGFFDADPDQPVIIGRLHNATAPVPYRLPISKTVSTWRSASVPATGGFNELKFDDAAGQEVVSVQAERDMATLVKNNETISVGASRVTKIGATDDVTIGERHSITIAREDAVEGALASGTAPVSGEAPVTRIEATPSKIVLSTGQARITLEGPNITFDAPGAFILRAAERVRIESSRGDVVVQGGPIVRINPRGAGEHPDAPGGAIPYDLPDGESADAFDDFLADVARCSWFNPSKPTYLDDATNRGGELDPTPRGEPGDELRAFKYAVAGRSLGMPEGVLARRAGALNLAANGANAGEGNPGNGLFGGEAPYGTGKAQFQALKKGFAFFDEQYAKSE